MKRLFRPQIVVIGAIAVSLLAWSAGAAVAGSRGGSHVAVRNAESVHAASRAETSPEPTEAPTAPAVEQNQAEEAAEEQNEQAEAAEDENENEDEQEAENPAPAASPAAVMSKTFNLVGGTVTFSCSGSAISLVSAVPNSGFSVETEREDGNQEIKVKFESDAHKSEIQTSCVGGQVQATEIREESD